jgi:adenine-specific DNA-methyltransferase
MNTNYTQIKTYISSIKKYQIKSIEIDNNNQEIENISINYKLLNEDINNIDKDLISNLIKNKLCKELFFDKIEDIYVFNQNKFIEVMFHTNEYMKGSYTKYSSDIGLFLKDEDRVQLNFPYKDCVLVGGMDKEDDKVNLEVFYNEILEKDKINKLFEPKVFNNIKKYSYDKKLAEDDNLDNHNNIQVDNDNDKIEFTTIEEDGVEKQKLKDNLLIKGNNLLGLHSIARRLSGSIDVIYIDPPYYFNKTKSSDSFAYNSNFKLSTWLTFMKNRLEIAKELLSDKGVIFISMNEDGNSYLKLLCDDVFGVDNYYGNLIWKKQDDNRKETSTILIENENILCYGYNIKLLKRKSIPEMNNVDNDERGNWFNANISSPITNENSKNVYEIDINGTKHKRRWWLDKKELEVLINENKIYVPKNGEGTPRRKMFLEDFLKEKNQFTNLLLNYGTSTSAKNNMKDLLLNLEDFDTPKPIELINHLIDSINNPNSTILDFFAGSGTTAHSVLSLNKEDNGSRKFILLEQMDYIETITAERIKRSMIKDGYEDSFIYVEMKESDTKELKNQIKSSKNKEELIYLINDNFNNGYFINIDNKEQLLLKIENIYNQIENKNITKTNNIEKFNQLFLLESIKLVIEKYMDNNLDYVSYEDIEELKLSNKIKENEYKLNKSFYEEV